VDLTHHGGQAPFFTVPECSQHWLSQVIDPALELSDYVNPDVADNDDAPAQRCANQQGA
jgi:hypothetical protein